MSFGIHLGPFWISSGGHRRKRTSTHCQRCFFRTRQRGKMLCAQCESEVRDTIQTNQNEFIKTYSKIGAEDSLEKQYDLFDKCLLHLKAIHNQERFFSVTISGKSSASWFSEIRKQLKETKKALKNSGHTREFFSKRSKEERVKEEVTKNAENMRKEKILAALKTPYCTPLAGIKDDRRHPPIEFGEMSEEEFDHLWNIWGLSQKAIRTLQSSTKSAWELLIEAEKNFPDSQFIQYAKAWALYRMGKISEAYTIVKDLPDQEAFINIKIDGALLQKDFETALSHIMKLPTTQQTETRMLFKHASCLIELEKYTTALEVLTNFNYHKPENRGKVSSFWHYLRGQCYKGLDQKGKSIRELEKSQAYPLPDVDVQKEIDDLRLKQK